LACPFAVESVSVLIICFWVAKNKIIIISDQAEECWQ
jgi:hypothetical protein